MPVIRLAGTDKVLYRFPPLLLDEFIPVVEFDRSKFEQQYGFLSAGPEVTLSKYIDDGLRKMETKVVDTESRKIKLPFMIKKGSPKTYDLDGIIDVKLSVSDPEVHISGKKSFKVKFGDSIEVEIDIKKKSDVEFNIDFYAQDDDEGELNKGELKDLHCGRTKIAFKFRSVVVIIVGTDSQDEHQHKSEDNFIRRLDRLINTQTIENLALASHEFVYVLVPISMSAANIAKLRAYGNGLSHYEVQQKNASELTIFLNSLKNIRSLAYFGHGIEAGPLYEYGVSRLPDPSSLQRSSFAPSAIAYFMTCNSKLYAHKFASTLGVNCIGVEGTTYYGTEEISAGRLSDTSAAGTSIAWRYDVTTSGIVSNSYSLSQLNGTPFLKRR
jgi:hypothetical protein